MNLTGRGEVIACRYAYLHTPPLSFGCERRGMGLRRPLPSLTAGGRRSAAPRPAGGLQRPALDRADRRAVAAAAARLAAVAGGLPTGPALAGGALLRGTGGRSAPAVAGAGGPPPRADGGDPGQQDAAIEPREW